MPFTCAICSVVIQVGEEMLSDDRMSVAHKDCVNRMIKDPVHVHPPPTPPPKVTMAVKKIGGSGFGNPTASIGAPGEPCLMPSHSPKVCSECQKPAISMCPGCRELVHQDFGYNGKNCSGRHEARCEGAQRSRERSLSDKQIREIMVTGSSIGGTVLFLAPKNGKHSKRTDRKKKGHR